MDFSIIAETFSKMDETTKRLELTDLLAELFKRTEKEIINKVTYLIQGKLYPDYKGVEIGIAEKLAIKALSLSSGLSLEEIEKLYSQLGDLGEVAYQVSKERRQLTLFNEPLKVERVYLTLERIAKASGPGAIEIKLRNLVSLLNDSEPLEAKYIMRIVLGQLRLGVSDYTILDALALAFTGSKENRSLIERAYNISSDLGEVAKVLALKGLEGLKEFKVKPGVPIRPMLAERLSSAKEILEKLNYKGAAEYKLDGERLQIHREKDKFFIFSRRLENITNHYPDVIELCKKGLVDKDFIIEGEAVAINEDTGDYLPFQELMHRRRKYGIEEAMEKYPVALNLFDLLYLDGEDYTQKSYLERRKKLEEIIKVKEERLKLVPMLIVKEEKEIEDFMEKAISEGCEGLVVKDLNSIYRAGAREFSWIKLKREYRSELTDTLDLVIIGAFYGRGRRAGKYGAFLLSSYDKEENVFRSVCKIGTGFTDEDLDNFPKILEPYKVTQKPKNVDSKMEPDVWFYPKVVIEVIGSEITLSPIHTCCKDKVREGSGLALRFPKFTGRIREDKNPEDATTDSEILKMYQSQLKKIVEEVKE